MTTHIIEGKQIIFTDHAPHTAAEAEAYLARAAELRFADWARVEAITITFEGEDAILDYAYKPVPFERIRRITGYLVGTTDRWNNAKRAEERDRVKHQEDELQEDELQEDELQADARDWLNPHRMVGR